MICLFICVLAVSALVSCAPREKEDDPDAVIAGGDGVIVGRDIASGDINDFYYTYYNINFNAFYQRYRFYKEDGKYWFFHETRARENDYGPLDESDTTETGTIELSESRWNDFFDLIKGGEVEKRKDSDESGDSGPWMYIYWNGDKGVYQEYYFPSPEEMSLFTEHCEKLKRGGA